MEDYSLIPLHGKHGTGKFAKVSPEDYERLSQYRWNLSSHGYVSRCRSRPEQRAGLRKFEYMHREVVDAEYVDHINHDRTDNRRENLRPATQQQNSRNMRHLGGRSAYKGVSWHKQNSVWRAYIKVERRQIHIGCFKSEAEAARAYDRRARELFGEYTYLNNV